MYLIELPAGGGGGGVTGGFGGAMDGGAGVVGGSVVMAVIRENVDSFLYLMSTLLKMF